MTASPSRCSVPLVDADLSLDNANWMKGLQAASDWIWSGNLNPVAFPNNLARYFLQIPAIFEHQLHFSTSLIFDEPSFRNGVQVSGFLDRVSRELVISLIAQRRRARYTMTHHAVLGMLTARKHGIPDSDFASKLVHLSEHRRFPQLFTTVEREVLKFADTFATDPKRWTEEEHDSLRKALSDWNFERYPVNGMWMDRLNAARSAYRGKIARGESSAAEGAAGSARDKHEPRISSELNERMVNAQLVELAFLCLQFVALADVFSSLNIPDEPFLPAVMEELLPAEVLRRIEELIATTNEHPPLTPPTVHLPLAEIESGRIKVASAPLRGTRVPLVSYEIDGAQRTRDKGLAVGGVQVGAFGWSFGEYFPGGLVYLLMHHPELARFEAPYSLPLLFNEDEWRNGTQTGGFVSRLLKELAFLKIYTTTRARYGLEHHTMFLFNIFLDEYGVGRPPCPPLSEPEKALARKKALDHAESAVLHVDSPDRAPPEVFSEVDLALFAWIDLTLKRPHTAQAAEPRLRSALDMANRRDVACGVRRLDASPGIGDEAAFARLLDHQICELAMLIGHMDGLGRAMTILRLESEGPVSRAENYWFDRPGLFQVYDFIGITERARTANELRLNPHLLAKLNDGSVRSPVDAETSARYGEF